MAPESSAIMRRPARRLYLHHHRDLQDEWHGSAGLPDNVLATIADHPINKIDTLLHRRRHCQVSRGWRWDVGRARLTA